MGAQGKQKGERIYLCGIKNSMMAKGNDNQTSIDYTVTPKDERTLGTRQGRLQIYRMVLPHVLAKHGASNVCTAAKKIYFQRGAVAFMKTSVKKGENTFRGWWIVLDSKTNRP